MHSTHNDRNVRNARLPPVTTVHRNPAILMSYWPYLAFMMKSQTVTTLTNTSTDGHN